MEHTYSGRFLPELASHTSKNDQQFECDNFVSALLTASVAQASEDWKVNFFDDFETFQSREHDYAVEWSGLSNPMNVSHPSPRTEDCIRGGRRDYKN